MGSRSDWETMRHCAETLAALEVVYWGMFPATATIGATGNVTSMIDFSDLTYNGANANVPFTPANYQQVSAGYSFNSLEANLVGNSWSGSSGL